MRTYDPADHILYVHPAQEPAAPPHHAHDDCHRLPAGYPNESLRDRLGDPRAAGARAALTLLRGGSAAADGPAPAAPGLRLAQ
jgi:hypothetical protein